MIFLLECLSLFYKFFKIGVCGFGGGYTIMSMIMMECEKLSITFEQFADLNVLDMVVPGPIAINAATYVGYLHLGFWGALSATIGVMLPSFIIITLVMSFIQKYKDNSVMVGFLSGVKPAAVGLILSATFMLASGVLVKAGADSSAILSDPVGTLSLFMIAVFTVTAVANIKFKINPILLTLLAGLIGAFFA